MPAAQLVFSDSFLDALAELPRSIEKKVRKLIKLYRKDPTSPGIHFEKLPGMKDDKFRSLRVDRSYRLIASQPPLGDVLTAMWVDHHDEAYKWARSKVVEVNPALGGIQVYSVEEVERAMTSVEPAMNEGPVAVTKRTGLLDEFDDQALVLAGVPELLLESVRAIDSEERLEAMAKYLPNGVAEMLYALLAGYSPSEALEQIFGSSEPAREVDTEDFAKALQSPASQGAFWVVEGEDELERMLDAPLEKWRAFLHPSQRKLVERKASGPMRVLGGAGTGKTVVLMHRARYLAERIFAAPNDRLLVTTFTKNLALDLRKGLESLCPKVMDRLEVQNLHAWALSVCARAHGRRVNIIRDHERSEAMQEAKALAGRGDLPLAFYLEEWDRVVQAQEIADETGYVRARRVGRGTRLSARQRGEVWRVFTRYKELLASRGAVEMQDVVRMAREAISAGCHMPGFRAVLADEVQDFSPGDLRLLRAIVPPGDYDLFLVGDAHQRIYGHATRLSACGIDVRGRSRRLRLNYRTTEQIRTHAISVLEGLEIDDLDGGLDSLKGYRSLRTGPAPRIELLSSFDEEVESIVSTIVGWMEDTELKDICVAARTNRLAKDYKAALASAGLDPVRLTANDPPLGAGVRVATLHRLKGLEFRRLIIAGVNEGAIPAPLALAGDDGSKAEHLKSERCLLYVGMTRARDQVMLTGHGRPSPFVSP